MLGLMYVCWNIYLKFQRKNSYGTYIWYVTNEREYIAYSTLAWWKCDIEKG